jgi:hypothetical protein
VPCSAHPRFSVAGERMLIFVQFQPVADDLDNLISLEDILKLSMIVSNREVSWRCRLEKGDMPTSTLFSQKVRRTNHKPGKD